MKPITAASYVLTTVAATALLAACGGSQPPVSTPLVASDGVDSLPYHKTFHYTGKKQSFKVPSGVKWLTVVALGAAGGGSSGGHGGRVFAEIPVVAGERLAVYVGGTTSDISGGYNGGGRGVYGTNISYGGGGASDIRQGGNGLRHRVLIVGAGGGYGGDGYDQYGSGGKGGGSTAGTGANGNGASTSHSGNTAGSGGTQYAGGAGGQGGAGGYGRGYPGTDGSLGNGGSGGEDAGWSGGGGGGGGYYGGGGGGGGGWGYGDYEGGGGGGGGGSTYIEPTARKFRAWRGWKTATGDGLVVISWQ